MHPLLTGPRVAPSLRSLAARPALYGLCAVLVAAPTLIAGAHGLASPLPAQSGAPLPPEVTLAIYGAGWGLAAVGLVLAAALSFEFYLRRLGPRDATAPRAPVGERLTLFFMVAAFFALVGVILTALGALSTTPGALAVCLGLLFLALCRFATMLPAAIDGADGGFAAAWRRGRGRTGAAAEFATALAAGGGLYLVLVVMSHETSLGPAGLIVQEPATLWAEPTLLMLSGFCRPVVDVALVALLAEAATRVYLRQESDPTDPAAP